jgi:hypothetical protein
MSAFTLYWLPETVDRYREDSDEGGLYAGTLSGQFSRRGVGRGDWIYPVHVCGGLLGVVCRMQVESVDDNCDPAPDDWPEVALAIPDSRTPMRFANLLSESLGRRLRFVSDEAPDLLVKRGAVDPRGLQTMRELTPESAKLLDELIDGRG